MRSTFTVLACLLLLTAPALAQLQTTNHYFRERKFLFEVKQLDEFFERFNDQQNSFIRQHIKDYFPKVRIDRRSLLTTLFDNNRRWINEVDKKLFIESVSNSRSPRFLRFEENGWYAHVSCSFTYEGKPVTVKLKMEIVTDSTQSSKWLITEAYCPAWVQKTAGMHEIKQPDPGKFINPMSHATNFSSLARVFDDVQHLSSYFAWKKADKTTLALIDALMAKKLRFQQVQAIEYTFLQIPGWQFKVAACNRPDAVNSGWLIVALQRLNTTAYVNATRFTNINLPKL